MADPSFRAARHENTAPEEVGPLCLTSVRENLDAIAVKEGRLKYLVGEKGESSRLVLGVTKQTYVRGKERHRPHSVTQGQNVEGSVMVGVSLHSLTHRDTNSQTQPKRTSTLQNTNRRDSFILPRVEAKLFHRVCCGSKGTLNCCPAGVCLGHAIDLHHGDFPDEP